MNDDVKKCPYCVELIEVDAVKCKHCGEIQENKKEVTEFRAQKSNAPDSASETYISNESEGGQIKKEKSKPNKLLWVLGILASVIIVSLLISIYFLESDIPILKRFTNNKEQTTEMNSSKSDSEYESNIKGLLRAEDQRDFDQIVKFYNLKEMKRYWDYQNPTYDDLRNAYSKSWNITSKSSNKIHSINKVREKVYDVNLDFTFYQSKKQEWKTVNNTVRFVFDQNNKIIEVHGVK